MKKFTLFYFFASFSIAANAQLHIKKTPQDELKIEHIIKQLTLEEKIQMCSGINGGDGFSGVKRLNIPEVKVTDGPRGVTRVHTSTAFPTGIGLASTWDLALVKKANNAMGKEAKAAGFGVLLAPGINIERDPLNGRFFEYYTEDPFLNGETAVAAVKGIQEEGVAACLKHYACNNREDNRNFYMSMLDDRTMNEIYLPGFKAAVKKADLLTVMTSANGVNGEFVSDSKKMLKDMLKDEWGFQGIVLTDWLQTRSTEKAALAGLDISMPGGNDCGFGTPLLQSVKAGRVPVEVIDDKVRRILSVYQKLGYLDSIRTSDRSITNASANEFVAKEVAEQGIILLKNQHHVLPLTTNSIHHLLVMGPNADKKICFPGGGGSSGVRPPYEVTPLQGIIKTIGAEKVTYLTSEDLGGFQVIPASDIENADGSKGLKAAYFVNGSNDALVNRIDSTLDFMWEMKSPDPKIDPNQFSKAIYSAKLIPPIDGKYTVRMIVNGIANMYHGTLQGEHIGFADSRQTLNIANISVELKKGVPYQFMIQFEKTPGDAAIRLEWELPEAPTEKMHRLDSIATAADAVIYVAGIDHSMDTEGRDRKDINFPGAQENMLNHLSKLNKKVVTVLINGSPLQLGNWLPNVPSVIEAWYPGMEGGTAIANILFGKVNPSGKLTVSWPKKLSEVPCKILGTENNDMVNYQDSLMVGYRYYDTRKKEVEFPFGYGLSYTIFRYGNVILQKSGDAIEGKINLKNIGKIAGSEIVQVYVKPVRPSVFRPEHELKAFKKIHITSGKDGNVSFSLGPDAFSFYDVKSKRWKVDHGNYIIEVGSSSRDIRTSKEIYY